MFVDIATMCFLWYEIGKRYQIGKQNEIRKKKNFKNNDKNENEIKIIC